jgi:3-oxoacyl-[acyl-carrier protein] reductase
MSRRGMRPNDVAQYNRNIPLGRFGQPQEVAEAVWYLVSGNADYMTGTTLHVNGGLFMN